MEATEVAMQSVLRYQQLRLFGPRACSTTMRNSSTTPADVALAEERMPGVRRIPARQPFKVTGCSGSIAPARRVWKLSFAVASRTNDR